jgi:hypothetical protein
MWAEWGHFEERVKKNDRNERSLIRVLPAFLDARNNCVAQLLISSAAGYHSGVCYAQTSKCHEDLIQTTESGLCNIRRNCKWLQESFYTKEQLA